MDDNELEIFNNEMEGRFSSIINKSRQLDVRSIELLIELVEIQIEDNTKDLIISIDPRNITILQGKILGHRDLLKILNDIKNIKNNF